MRHGGLAVEPQGIFLSLLPQCWDSMHAPRHPAFYVGAGDHTKAPFLHSKRTTNCHFQVPLNFLFSLMTSIRMTESREAS